MDIQNLLNFLKSSGQNIFIEAEAKPDRMNKFFIDYNSISLERIDEKTKGIVLLDQNANKRGLELRVYLQCDANTPEEIILLCKKNTSYHIHKNYSHRINNIKIVNCLFSHGYKIGLN